MNAEKTKRLDAKMAGGSKGALGLWCQHRLGVIIVGGPFAEVWVSCGSQGYSLGDDMIFKLF